MITKTSSILDYSYPFLDPAVWDQDMKLYSYQKDFILRLLDKMYETYDLKDHEKWVEDVVILGSLTTTKWLLSSDLDVHVRVNLDEFVKTNMPNASKEEAFEKLDLTRKEFDRAKILAPMTQHPTEFYIESLELHPSNTSEVGVYSLYQDKWLKEPIALPAELDIEESKRKVVEEAEALAQELDGSLGKIRRDIQRVDELDAVIQAWGKDKQKLFYSKIEKKLNDIEEEIKKDLKIKQDLVDYRHSNQDPTSENEILFKYLARNGFFAILQNLKELLESTDGEVTVDELPLIEKVISQAYIKQAASTLELMGYRIYVNPTELQTKALLRKSKDQALRGLVDPITNDLYVWDAFYLEHSQVSNYLGIDVNIEDDTTFGVTDRSENDYIWVVTDPESIHWMFEAQQKIKQEKSTKKLSMSKFASFMKKANENIHQELNNKILVDFDGTIAQDMSDHSIGEPINGVKEALQKLKDMGYELEIFSSRANDENGLEEIKEYLDKHAIPYDSIFQGEKPLAKYYIDNSSIHFDNWTNVLKQVEKSEKKASLHVTALDAYYHGGSGTSIRQMAKDGYVAAPLETGRRHQSPLPGRSYLTKDLSYALIYALGGDMIGKNISDLKDAPWLQGEGGVVLVAPNEETLIPDEDWLGEKLTSGYELMSERKPSNDSIFEHLTQIPALQPVFSNMSKARNLWDASYQSMIGKMAIRILMKSYPEYLKKLAQESHTLSHEGNLKVLKAWVFDKQRDNSKLKRDGSNFFDVAQEIPVTKTASLKKSSLSTKYWIDPNGKEYEIEDIPGHYGFIKEQFPEKSSDEIQEIADRMIAEGWARVTSGQETSEGSDFAMEVADLKRLPNYIDNFIANHYTDNGIEIDDLQGNYVKVIDPFPSMQKQVNKALRQPVMAKVFSKKEITAQTKKVKQGEYSAIMAVVPHDIAQEIVEWGVRNIKDSDVFSDEENTRLGRELEPHITVKYGLLTDDIKSVRQFFNEAKPFKAKLGKVKHFEPPEMDFDVVTVEVVSEDLERMNKEVTDHFECAEGLVSDEYHPHITVSYVGRGKGKDYIGSSEFEGKEIILDTLIVSPRKGNRTYFSISQDKESRFVLEKINKIASEFRAWVDPNGKVFYTEGDTHASWINDNLEFLEREYGLKVSKKVWNQRMRYYKLVEEQGDSDNIDLPDIWGVEDAMFNSGWVRIGDVAYDKDIGIELKNLRAIPSFLDNILPQFVREGLPIVVEDRSKNSVTVTYPFKSLQQAVNKALSSPTKTASVYEIEGVNVLVNPTFNEVLGLWKRSNSKHLRLLTDEATGDKYIWDAYFATHEDIQKKLTGFRDTLRKDDLDNLSVIRSLFKTASGNNFYPSLVQAPNNEWQFEHGGDDQEIPVDPDAVSDEETFYAPCTVGKPRNPDMWKSLWHMIKSPFSKKEVESASDPVQEKIEQEELGENETLLEYSKGFKDLNRLNTNKPKTTWSDNSSSQGGEPYTPLPSFHVETNPANENWRYPWKFTSRPRGEDSDDGKTIEMLQEQEKRKACIERMTRDITASSPLYANGYWITPNGDIIEIDETHMEWITINFAMLKDKFQINSSDPMEAWNEMLSKGWARITSDEERDGYGIEVFDLKNIPFGVDNFVAKFPPTKENGIIVEDGKNAVAIQDPFPTLQKAVNKALQRKRLGKKADLPPQQFIPEHLNASTAIQTDDGSIYWSDEPRMIHVQFIKELGIPVEHIISGGRIVDGIYHDSGPRSDTMRYVEQMLAKKRVEEKRKSIAKKAGSYSASVPDYQGEQYYNEQHMDNGGEVNYVNKDHVDNGYGFRDFNDSSTDYPKPEDISPAVVHLDILNKPINRTDPFGMTWYSVVLYDAAPMSNGIESVNPD